MALFALPLAALTDGELRTGLTDASRRELLNLAQNEVKRDSLGEWKDVIDTSLFMLFRRTELFRGTMRVLVISSRDVVVKLYPEGTFVLSTGLLDYIDSTLFDTASSSPRRMRNFDSEREMMLIPLLVPEAAHFALDHPFTAYKKNQELPVSFVYTGADILEADRFSVILLNLAGFDPSVLDFWFDSLNAMYRTDTGKGVFSVYLAPFPSPEKRSATVSDSRENIQKISGEFSSVLSNLRAGVAFRETLDSLASLREVYPSSTYISRLEALVLHRQWLASVPPSVQKLKTFFPLADENDPFRSGFLDLLKNPPPAFPSPKELKAPAVIPGDSNIFVTAVEAYKKVIPAYSDSGLSSSYAMLLFASGNSKVRELALVLGEGAAKDEGGKTCFTARANYASLLYLSGTDYAKAQFILNSNLSTNTGVGLNQGIAGDERDIFLNSALMLRSLGDMIDAKVKMNKLENLLSSPLALGTIPFRLVYIGNSTDELVSKWGYPATIMYNYYTENWDYPSLSASVLVARDTSGIQRAVLLRFGPGSPWDAFSAAYAVAIAEGKGPVEAARFGVAAGAFAVTRREVVPGLGTREELAAVGAAERA